jgi:hypothetical protein
MWWIARKWSHDSWKYNLDLYKTHIKIEELTKFTHNKQMNNSQYIQIKGWLYLN